MNWRELRKELFDSPPRPRTSQTYQHDDIFNSKNPSIAENDNIGRSSYRTPKRVRENDTTRSQILDKSEAKCERPLKVTGIKTFKSIKTLQEEKYGIRRQQSAHKIKDHGDDYFYIVSDENFRTKLVATQVSPSRQEIHYQEISCPGIRKQEEILGNEVGKLVLYPDHSECIREKKLIYIVKLIQKCKSQSDILDRQLHQYPNATCQEKRLLHNESNIFQNENYIQKVSIPLNQSPKKKETEVEVKQKSFQQQQQFDPREIDSIKRKNHNFSDVFGLEYGSREPVSQVKSQQRNLSPTLKWTEIDTIKNRKDIGCKNKPTMIHSRSRLMDQKSSQDTHNYYENLQVKPFNKETRITTRNDQLVKNINMLRTNVKGK